MVPLMKKPYLPLLFLPLLLAVLFFFFLFIFLTTTTSTTTKRNAYSYVSNDHLPSRPRLKVFVADLPQSLNYGLLESFWSLNSADSRLSSASDDPDLPVKSSRAAQHPQYPENPLIKQYNAEYWLLGDLMAGGGSVAERIWNWRDADVVFVPFFAALSAEMELGWGKKGSFSKKEGNGDFKRQWEVVNHVRSSDAWRRSGGKDHVFVLTDPVAMWHVREEISSAILLVVDFGGWYKLDSKTAKTNSSNTIQHMQVSLLKDVIVPYTHHLPTLKLSENQHRHSLLYFKGAKHRHRGGLVREKLWDLLINEPGVVMEEGFPNATGREQSIKGMRSSEFCLHPAGDTPTSCRLFDAVASLCIPVIVSDNIELPFEGAVDYSDFSIFVSVSDALRPGWLLDRLRGVSKEQKQEFRRNISRVQPIFEYESGHPGGIGPAPPDGAVNHIWQKIYQKLPMIKEAIIRDKRKLPGVAIPLRCHCT